MSCTEDRLDRLAGLFAAAGTVGAGAEGAGVVANKLALAINAGVSIGPAAGPVGAVSTGGDAVFLHEKGVLGCRGAVAEILPAVAVVVVL
jgi:hypothetical protein